MNHWKYVWDAYYNNATRRAYVYELVRIASWPTRILFVLALMAFIIGLTHAVKEPSQDWPWLMLLGEFLVLGLVEHVRTEKFAAAYGSTNTTLGPAEKEDQRGDRYLLFKKSLESRDLTSKDVAALFDILASKEELETQHNVNLNKFVFFVLGFFASAAIALIQDLDARSTLLAIIWVGVASLILAPLIWMLPTRMGRIKELKYFMVLYCRTD